MYRDILLPIVICWSMLDFSEAAERRIYRQDASLAEFGGPNFGKFQRYTNPIAERKSNMTESSNVLDYNNQKSSSDQEGYVYNIGVNPSTKVSKRKRLRIVLDDEGIDGATGLEGLENSILDANLLERVQKIIDEHERQSRFRNLYRNHEDLMLKHTNVDPSSFREEPHRTVPTEAHSPPIADTFRNDNAKSIETERNMLNFPVMNPELSSFKSFKSFIPEGHSNLEFQPAILSGFFTETSHLTKNTPKRPTKDSYSPPLRPSELRDGTINSESFQNNANAPIASVPERKPVATFMEQPPQLSRQFSMEQTKEDFENQLTARHEVSTPPSIPYTSRDQYQSINNHRETEQKEPSPLLEPLLVAPEQQQPPQVRPYPRVEPSQQKLHKQTNTNRFNFRMIPTENHIPHDTKFVQRKNEIAENQSNGNPASGSFRALNTPDFNSRRYIPPPQYHHTFNGGENYNFSPPPNKNEVPNVITRTIVIHEQPTYGPNNGSPTLGRAIITPEDFAAAEQEQSETSTPSTISGTSSRPLNREKDVELSTTERDAGDEEASTTPAVEMLMFGSQSDFSDEAERPRFHSGTRNFGNNREPVETRRTGNPPYRVYGIPLAPPLGPESLGRGYDSVVIDSQ